MDSPSIEKKKLRQQDKRSLILEKAREMITAGEEITASAIARALGWKTPGVYYYFPNLESIKNEIIKDLISENVELTLHAARLCTGVEKMLISVFEARIRYYIDKPGDFELMWKHFVEMGVAEEILENHLYPQFGAMVSELEQRLEKGKQKGEVAQEVHSRRLINLIFSMAQGILLLYTSFEKTGGKLLYSLEEMIEEGRIMIAKSIQV